MDQYKHKRRELKDRADELEALQAALNAMTHEVIYGHYSGDVLRTLTSAYLGARRHHATG
jgi:hypothetical protein